MTSLPPTVIAQIGIIQRKLAAKVINGHPPVEHVNNPIWERTKGNSQ